jgi:hypothetical protein
MIDRPGRFRAHPVDWSLQEAKESSAVSVYMEFAIDEYWDTGTKSWISWSEYDHHVNGSIWLIKRDGSINENASKTLIEALGWKGDVDDLNRTDTWTPHHCQIVVEEDTYNGKTKLKVAWVNPYDSSPTIRKMEPQKIGQVKAALGSQFRALAANIRRNGPQPIPAKPKVEPPPPLPVEPPPEAVAQPVAAEDDLPF